MESRFFRVTAAALLGLVIVLAGVVSSQDTNGEEEDQGFEHQDARCLCKCPDVSIVTDRELLISDRVVLDTSRSIYINSSVTPQDCDCANVVLGYLDLTPTQADAFCPRFVIQLHVVQW